MGISFSAWLAKLSAPYVDKHPFFKFGKSEINKP
jgi:hypothetical protein